MKRLEQLIVFLDFGTQQIDVGELVYTKGQIYFKYYSEFLVKGLNISPYKLPLNSGIFELK